MDQSPQPRTRPTDDHDYYASVFWDDLPLVKAYINAQMTGDPDVTWSQHFARTVGRTFERALILGCGDGRIERLLFDEGLLASSVGVDIGEAALASARELADGRPLEYVRMDFNEELPDGPFDLIVNYGSAHHVTYVDRVFRGLCERLDPDGWLVAVDYVGPHRNQYPADAWLRSVELDEGLPPELQRGIRWKYPHIPTMVAVDPTEAVHPELVPEVMGRYFDVVDDAGVGGAVAYEVLTHNEALHSASDEARDAATRLLLEADAEYLRAHPGSSLFSYVTARPRRDALDDPAQLARWSAEEDAREEAAAANGGVYYEHEPVPDLYLELERRRLARIHLEERVALVEHHLGVLAAAARQNTTLLNERVRALGVELDELHASTSWRVTAPLRAAADALRRVRAAWRARSAAA